MSKLKMSLEVVADTNDADYVTARKKITEEQLKELEPVFKAIKKKKGHSWETTDWGTQPEDMYRDILTDDQIAMFQEFCPHGEYGIHTIESIKVLIAEERKIL